MSAPEPSNGNSLPIPIDAGSAATGAAAAEASHRPGSGGGGSKAPSGLPPASPGMTPPRSQTGRRSIDSGSGRRSMDGGSGRRSTDGGSRRGRHTVEVPEGAGRHEGLVVSRQEKFGFIKCTTHEGRYFFHVNDSDGQTTYGAIVSFVIAKDLTTGKDVAFNVKTLAPPMGGGSPAPAGAAGSSVRSSTPASRSATPDRAVAAAGAANSAALAAAEGSSFYRGDASPAGAAEGNGGAATGDAATVAAHLHANPQHQGQGQGQGQHHRPPAGQHGQHYGGHSQHPHPHQRGQQFAGGPGQQQQQQQPLGGRAPYEHFGQHRQPSPASQRDWRLPREQTPPPQQPHQQQGQQGPLPGGHVASRHSSSGTGAGPSAEGSYVSMSGGGGPPGLEASPPARYRGTVAQPARAGRHHMMDDGLLLYIDEQGAQQQARYGNGRLAEGTRRLEAGDVVEFELSAYPGAGHGHRQAAANVCFLSKSLLPSPSLEAALAANEAGDSLRGRQLGRVTLLKKEFGFIRQMDRPGDMFFHFSQLEGWTPDDLKVGDDVEYTIRRDRDGTKLSAVQIRRAPPGAVLFETVSEELLRGVVLERPQLGKQYMGSSGVLEYAPAEADAAAASAGGAAAGGEAVVPGAPGFGKARLPFSPQDVAQGSGSLRAGDHVTFRVLTNLQAAKAAAQASVPGAAAYAGKRAVEVSFVRYAGTIVQVNKERQFGFISYGEDQLLPAGPPRGAGEGESEGGEAEAGAAPAPAAPAEEAAGPAAGEPKAVGEEGAKEVPACEAAPPTAAAEPAAAPEAGAAVAAAAPEAAAGGDGAGEAASPAPAAPQAKRSRIFFHFKEVAGQYLLKPGDEVVFVMHSNLKNGELNAQRVRRTKEGPELPPPPEPAPKPAPVPAVNPNRQKYSGNLSTGGYKQPKIAKGPDGTRGFELPRPNAIMPPLPGLEPKPEPEPEQEEEAAAAAAGEEEAAAAAAAGAAKPMAVDEAVAAAATLPLPLPLPVVAPAPAPKPAVAPGLSLAQSEARQAHAAAVRGATAAVPVAVPAVPAAAAAAPVAGSVAVPMAGVAGVAGSPPDGSDPTSPSWQGSTPFSSLAAMSLGEARVAEASLDRGLSTHLSAEAPVFVPGHGMVVGGSGAAEHDSSGAAQQ